MTLEKPIRLLELRSAWGAGGGPEKTILLSAARHDPRRVKAHVVYLRAPGDREFASGIGARARELGVAITEVADGARFDPRCIAKLRQLARHADVIHAHDYKTDVYALFLGRGGGHAKLVATAHGWTGENRKVRFYQRLDFLALRRFDRVLAVSGPTREALVRGGVRPEKIDLVFNAIDETVWSPQNPAGDLRAELGLSRETLVLGTIARLSSEKGVDLLLEAVAKANAALELRGLPRPVVLVAGDGPERADLEWLARLRGVGEQVRFLGHRHDTIRVAKTFDVAVLPSRVENLPNALLEAMALGKPAVAFGVGGVPELLGDAGIAVPPRDTTGLASGIVALLSSPERRRELGAAARRRIERHFSFARRLDRVESIYEAVCREPLAAAKKWTWPWLKQTLAPQR